MHFLRPYFLLENHALQSASSDALFLFFENRCNVSACRIVLYTETPKGVAETEENASRKALYGTLTPASPTNV